MLLFMVFLSVNIFLPVHFGRQGSIFVSSDLNVKKN